MKAENDPRNDEAKMREFHDFLLQHANVDLDNYSRGPVENMRDALIHHLEYTKVIDKFKPWLKTKKGYTVPTSMNFLGSTIPSLIFVSCRFLTVPVLQLPQKRHHQRLGTQVVDYERQ